MAEEEVTVTPGSGFAAGVAAAFYKGTWQGVANRLIAPFGLVFVTGPANNRAFVEAPGDAAQGLDVDVTRVPADPFGANADAAVAAGAVGSMQAKFRRISADLGAVQTDIAELAGAVTGGRYQVDIVSGGLTITRPGTVAVTTPATSTGSGTIIVANVNRLGLEITNKSTSSLHLRRGAAVATEANSTIVIDPLSTWNDPTGYTGEIRGILAAGAGASTAAVAEFTA